MYRVPDGTTEEPETVEGGRVLQLGVAAAPDLWDAPAARRRNPLEPQGRGSDCGGGELFRTNARWMTLADDDIRAGGMRGPRHQTMRRKGVAPAYPKPADLAGAVTGALVLTPDALELHPRTGAGDRVRFTTRDMALRVFYRNAIEITHDAARRTIIGLAPQDAEVVDVIMQAYL